MVLRTYLIGKLHGLRLTDKNVAYQGSITLSQEFLEAAQIAPFESVQVVNVTTGARLMTYAIPTDEPGVCVMNGGAARLAEVGDELIVMAFAQSERPVSPSVVLIDAGNRIRRVLKDPLTAMSGHAVGGDQNGDVLQHLPYGDCC